jgi:serpin B
VRQEPVVFRADHPFVFAIRDNRCEAILFLGRVSEPGGEG